MFLSSITDPVLLVNRVPEIKKRLMIHWKIFSKTLDLAPKISSSKSVELYGQRR